MKVTKPKADKSEPQAKKSKVTGATKPVTTDAQPTEKAVEMSDRMKATGLSELAAPYLNQEVRRGKDGLNELKKAMRSAVREQLTFEGRKKQVRDIPFYHNLNRPPLLNFTIQWYCFRFKACINHCWIKKEKHRHQLKIIDNCIQQILNACLSMAYKCFQILYTKSKTMNSLSNAQQQLHDFHDTWTWITFSDRFYERMYLSRLMCGELSQYKGLLLLLSHLSKCNREFHPWPCLALEYVIWK